MSETKMTKHDAKRYAAGLASEHLNAMLRDLSMTGPTATRTRCVKDHYEVIKALGDIAAELSRRSTQRGK